MKKHFRSILSLTLAVILLLSCGVAALAATKDNVTQYGAAGGYLAIGDSISRGCGAEGFYIGRNGGYLPNGEGQYGEYDLRNVQGGKAKYRVNIVGDAKVPVDGVRLENVTVDAEGRIDFADKSVTENTRVSYPIDHIEKIVRPVSSAPAAKDVIFLSADAFGVLPPVSVLTPDQTKYYFLSGFTAKLAGTERGITEPTPTFSACFGQAFLELPPTKYADELVKRMDASGAKAYLVNTGWNGSGKRISIKDTRGIIDAILNGDILSAPTKTIPYFGLEVPTVLPGVDPAILDPRDTYADPAEWERKAQDLASRFIANFKKYETNEAGRALVPAGPQL